MRVAVVSTQRRGPNKMPRKKVLGMLDLNPCATPPLPLGDLGAMLDKVQEGDVLEIRRYADPALTPPQRGFHAVDDLTGILDEIEAEDAAAAFVLAELQLRMKLRQAS